MSNFSASIPVANMQAANDLLDNTAQTPGKVFYGPNNFSVPAYAGPTPSVGLLHAWGDPEFEAAVAAIPNVTITQGTDPIAMTEAAATSKGAKWGANAPQLPSSGNVTAGSLYQFDNLLWSVIQTFSRTTYNAHPSTYASLIRRVHTPGELQPWVQPTDQYDAYKLLNPFNGKPDQCTYGGFTWKVTQADGAGNNVWQPGVYGWAKV